MGKEKNIMNDIIVGKKYIYLEMGSKCLVIVDNIEENKPNGDYPYGSITFTLHKIDDIYNSDKITDKWNVTKTMGEIREGENGWCPWILMNVI